MENPTRIFGVRQVGIFCEKLRINDNGLTYKNQQYRWSDVIVVKRSDGLLNILSRFPSSTILLKDGKIIRLPVILEERGNKGSKSSYKECIDIFEAKLDTNTIELEKYLQPYSYIMFYRFAITVSLIQITLFCATELATARSMTSFDIEWLSIPVQFTLLGVYMLVRRHVNESTIKKKLKEKTF